MKDDIIRMAREAGLCDEEGRDDSSVIIENHLKRFAALLLADEREAAAKMVDHILKPGGGTWGDAIRARGQG
jgi:DNA-binding GntR family transcriptional regulator